MLLVKADTRANDFPHKRFFERQRSDFTQALASLRLSLFEALEHLADFGNRIHLIIRRRFTALADGWLRLLSKDVVEMLQELGKQNGSNLNPT